MEMTRNAPHILIIISVLAYQNTYDPIYIAY